MFEIVNCFGFIPRLKPWVFAYKSYNDDEDGPTVYTPDEAEEIKNQLDEIL